MTLRLSPQEDALLSYLAQSQGVSKQQAAIRAICAEATRRLDDDHVVELARTLLPSYRAVEHRLQQGF